MGETARATRVLVRRGLIALAVVAAVAALPATADAVSLTEITSVDIGPSGDDLVITWEDSNSPDPGSTDEYTVAEVRLALYSPDFSSAEGPNDGFWMPVMEQTLDQANRTITMPGYMNVWPMKFLLRLRHFDATDTTYSSAETMAGTPQVEVTDRFAVTSDAELAAYDDESASPVGFPSHGWGVTAEGGAPYRYYTSTSSGAMHTMTGTTGDPLGTPVEVTLSGPSRADGEEHLLYEPGRSTSVYFDAGEAGTTDDRYLMAYVTSRSYPVGLEDFQAIGLASSSDGVHFEDLDIVITSPTEPLGEVGDERHNYVGTPSLVVRDDLVYLYFLQDVAHEPSAEVVGDVDDAGSELLNDLPGMNPIYTHRPAVARASLTAVRAAAAAEEIGDYTNPGDLFTKFDDSGGDGFGADGLGGDAAPIIDARLEGQQSLDVVYSERCGVFYLVTTNIDFQTLLASGVRSTGSSVLVGASDSDDGTSFDMGSLKSDYKGAPMPFADILSTMAFTSGGPDPKIATSTGLDLLVNKREVPLDADGMDGQGEYYRLAHLGIEDTATC